MSRNLHFLGFVIPISSTPAGQKWTVPPPAAVPPACQIRNWQVDIQNGVLTADKVWLDFGINTVVLGIQVPVSDDGTTVTLTPGLWDNDFPGNLCLVTGRLDAMPQASGLRLDIGTLTVQGTFGAGSHAVKVDANGRLLVRMDEVVGPTFGWIAPLELDVKIGVDGGLIALDLSIGQIEFQAGGYELHTDVTIVDGGGDYLTIPGPIHPLRALALPLATAPTDQEFRFQGAAKPLSLHVERTNRVNPVAASDPLQVAIQANDYDLVLRLARKASGDSQATGLRLVPKADPGQAPLQLTLTTFGLGDALNQPVTWSLPADVSVPLKLRWGNDQRPSTLLLAPDPPAVGNAGQAITVTGLGMADNRLHGDITDALVNVAGPVTLAAAIAPLGQVVFLPGTVPGNLANEVDPGLLAEATALYVTWPAQDVAFVRARPGYAYRGNAQVGSSAAVEAYAFGGAPVALPAIPLAHVNSADMSYSKSFRLALDAKMTAISAPITPVVHETLRQEVPNPASPRVGLTRIFAVSDAATLGAARAAVRDEGPPSDDPLRLASFAVGQAFGIPSLDQPPVPLQLQVQRPAGAVPDYIIAEINGGTDNVTIPKLNFTIASNSLDIVLDPRRDVAGLPPSSSDPNINLPRAVIKLSRNLALSDILGNRLTEILPILPSELLAKDWVGAIFFGAPAKPGTGTLLSKLVPQEVVDGLQFTYLAATPNKPGGAPSSGYSISAYLEWHRTAPATDARPPGDRDDLTQEATFTFDSISARWDQTALQTMAVDCSLTFPRFLGLVNNAPTTIPIVGQFDQGTNTLKFSAHVSQPIALLSEDNETGGAGPIKQVRFKGAVLTLVGDRAHIAIDGSIDLNGFTAGELPPVGLDGVTEIDFNSLGIDLPQTPSLNLEFLQISYPSLRVNFDGPRYSIGPLVLKLFSLGIDFPVGGSTSFHWDQLVMLGHAPPTSLPCLLFGVRIELMKLPAILESSIQTLTFDLTIGAWPTDANQTRWTAANLTAGLTALGFDRLELDLFRFLEIAADKIAVSSDADTQTTWLTLVNASLKVVGTTLFSGLSAAFYVKQVAGSAKNGFILMWDEPLGDEAGLSVDWAVFGNNIVLPDGFVESAMALSPDDDDQTDFTNARNDLTQWVGQSPPGKPYQMFLPVDNTVSSADWIIGAGVTVLEGFFQGRFLYQEGHICALSLKGEFLSWVGLELGLSVSYIKGNRPDEDHFYISMPVPRVDVGDVSFTGGVVAFDFVVNGGFQLDLGFPWQNPDGSRQWYRTLGAIVTPFQGSGGFYVERRNLTLPAVPGLSVTQLAAGYGLQAGLGATFGGGIFTAWVTIGITVTIEGDLYLANTNPNPQQPPKVNLVALRLAGSIGVLFQGHAGLNWWIISIDVDVCVGAEAAVTLEWTSNPALYQQLPGMADARSDWIVSFDFTVYASASASACIRLGFVSLCQGISVSIPMRAQYQLTL
jgi:hypothetical protein